ncbi:MAG: WD40 repeat domain-containing serine/threonine protein kinase, partial [Gemmataceae bacterium]
LDACPDCIGRLHTLSDADTFVESARRPMAIELPAPEVVERLRSRVFAHMNVSSSVDQTAAFDTPDVSDTIGHVPEIPEVAATEYEGNFADGITELGGYRILRLLGKGGMGFVFEAEDPQLARRVALKVIQPKKWKQHLGLNERFIREARATAAIKHDHIVTVYQVGEDRGIPFLAIELLDGESLDVRLRREKSLPVDEVLRIGREIALGLAAAHEKGLIHRDIKPGNIWVEAPSGRTKILDFGLARSLSVQELPSVETEQNLSVSSEAVTLTHAGMIVGTPAYMPPEQALSSPLTDRCDLFSLGCLMYHAATGSLPFQGTDTRAMLYAVVTEQPVAPRTLRTTIPVELDQLILKLLSKAPLDRPSALELVHQIEAIQQRLARQRIRNRLRGPVFCMALLALLGTAYFAGAGIYRVATNRGELVIETDDPNIEVTIRGAGEDVTIVDLVTTQKIELKAGEYQLQLGKPGKDLVLSADQFELRRGGKKVVEIRRIVPAEIDLRFTLPAGHVELRRKGAVVQKLPVAGKAALPPGEYEVALVGVPENLTWNPKTVSLQPGERRALALKLYGELRRIDDHGGTIGALSADSAGLVLSSSGDRTMSLWDVTTGLERKRFPFTKNAIHTCAISSDGKWAASATAKGASPDLNITLWDVENARVVGTLVGHTGWVSALAFTLDGEHLLSASQDGTVIQWHRAKRQQARKWTAHVDGVTSLAVSANGLFVTGGNDHRVRLWNLAQERALGECAGHTDAVRCVAISADGKRVASGGIDRSVRVWQTADQSQIHSFAGHDGWVNAVAFTPKGDAVLSASSDKSVRVWDVAGKAESVRLDGHTAGVQCLILAADGTRAITAGHDKTVRVWLLP